jgi:hypothetical protein
MKKIIALPLLFLLGVSLYSCTKEVELDLPPFVEKVVVEGRIEPGMPPFVILTRTRDFYGETGLDALANSFVHDAVITVSDGATSVTLTEICADNIDPDLLPLVSEILGIDPEQLAAINFCAYVSLSLDFVGEVGKTYSLSVQVGDDTYTSQTSLLAPPVIDSLYFQVEPNRIEHGFGWTVLNDNAATYNGYFFEMKRIHKNSLGEQADQFFRHSLNSAFDDTFFNGLTFKFAFTNIGSYRDDDIPDEFKGFFRTNDTVVIKLSSLDYNVFKFNEMKLVQVASEGNPFASPTYIPTNIQGGAIGCWAGFSPIYDTLICVP